jgi:uncharacterized protein YjbJ (UPF0337 family)
MNWDHIEANWQDLKGRFREKWGKLTDNDLETIGGKKDRLMAKLREYYADEKDFAEQDVNNFLDQKH